MNAQRSNTFNLGLVFDNHASCATCEMSETLVSTPSFSHWGYFQSLDHSLGWKVGHAERCRRCRSKRFDHDLIKTLVFKLRTQEHFSKARGWSRVSRD